LPSLRFLRADSDMARRILEFDWLATSLGPPEDWPQPLKLALGLCLHSAFPTAIYWGPEMRLLYNDSWAPIPAERHPWALGRPAAEVWGDIWDTVGPQMERVITTGEGFSAFDQLLLMERDGEPTETYWNYSFTPIVGEKGEILGIFNQGNEVTTKVMVERRQRFLLDFGDALRNLDDPREIIQAAQRLLGEHLNANRVGYGAVDPSERYFTTTGNWSRGVPPREGTHDLAGFGEPVHAALRRGEPLIIADVRSDPRTAHPDMIAAFEAIDAQAAMTASLVKGGRMVAALYVHSSAPREWTAADLSLVQEVAERTWAELKRLNAETEAGESELRFRRIFEQTSDLLITADLDQVVTDCNPSAAEAIGLPRDEVVGTRIADYISAEDYRRTSGMLEQKLHQGGTTRYDMQVQSRTGEDLFWEINSGLTYDTAGHAIGLHIIARDATERRRWEHHQKLLVAELNHRVKNSLAVVQSLARQTFSVDRNPADAIGAFEGRLTALAHAHNLLTRANWESASMSDLVNDALAPFCTGERCRIDGPELRIPPQTAVSLALALHELATNAAKYGALSGEGGSISVTWSADGGQLAFDWRERGGPPVKPPATTGFGSRMIRRALAIDLGGQVRLDFEPDGVCCSIRAPLPRPTIFSH
jgi:PAS domain S-box-containing protein